LHEIDLEPPIEQEARAARAREQADEERRRDPGLEQACAVQSNQARRPDHPGVQPDKPAEEPVGPDLFAQNRIIRNREQGL
jgi:hypothetical protein